MAKQACDDNDTTKAEIHRTRNINKKVSVIPLSLFGVFVCIDACLSVCR